jgi:hypothetical protein
MVRKGFRMLMGDSRLMIPEVSKTTILGPVASTAARKLPGPWSFIFVTLMTVPPLPPTLYAPKPSAPGKAGRVEARESERNKLQSNIGKIYNFMNFPR